MKKNFFEKKSEFKCDRILKVNIKAITHEHHGYKDIYHQQYIVYIFNHTCSVGIFV